MKKFYIVLLSIIVISFSILPVSQGVAFADSNLYSDVLSDLQVDEKFNKDDYIINQTDYSLNLIQIAESKDKELLVYVYQPSAGKNNVLAKFIRMSVDNGETFNDYSLTLLRQNGVFFKYKVDNYVTDYTSKQKRTYNVVQLLRPADETLGDTVLDENNNTISYIQYPVGWTFTAVNHDGELYYGKEKLETILITDKYCGQLKFTPDGFSSWAGLFQGVEQSDVMLHFIAFNTDKRIDDLQEAYISYGITDYTKYTFNSQVTENENERYGTKKLKKEAKESYKNGLFGHTYTWNEIMSKDDFVNNVVTSSEAFFSSSLTEKGAEEIANKHWVLCFLTTEITNITNTDGLNVTSTYSCSYITDETILRLQFMTDGELYSLGAVDNYQSGDGIPDNNEDYGINKDWWKQWWKEMQEWLKWILMIIGAVLLGVVLVIILPPVWAVIKFVFKIITAPFRWIFGSSRRKRR